MGKFASRSVASKHAPALSLVYGGAAWCSDAPICHPCTTHADAYAWLEGIPKPLPGCLYACWLQAWLAAKLSSSTATTTANNSPQPDQGGMPQ
jgi:hypothetical protein